MRPIVFGERTQIFVGDHGMHLETTRRHEWQLNAGRRNIRLVTKDRDHAVAGVRQARESIPLRRCRLAPIPQWKEAFVDMGASPELLEPSNVVLIPLLIGG